MEKPIHLSQFSPGFNPAAPSLPALIVQASVNMQAERLLRLVVFCPERAEYQLAGFSQPVVKLVDYRLASIQAMAQVLKAGRRDDFLPRFNIPARLILWADYPRQIRIELYETDQATPPYAFWIAQDPLGAIPLYPYLFRHSTRLDGANLVHLAVYRQLQAELKDVPALSRAA